LAQFIREKVDVTTKNMKRSLFLDKVQIIQIDAPFNSIVMSGMHNKSQQSSWGRTGVGVGSTIKSLSSVLLMCVRYCDAPCRRLVAQLGSKPMRSQEDACVPAMIHDSRILCYGPKAYVF
jgi:hypothetical protein